MIFVIIFFVFVLIFFFVVSMFFEKTYWRIVLEDNWYVLEWQHRFLDIPTSPWIVVVGSSRRTKEEALENLEKMKQALNKNEPKKKVVYEE